jgi:hypothetical protein
LEFPGAIFVGIHDDGTPNGLAASVRKDLPEDSIIIDLDTGEVECSGDRNIFISNTWDIIPESARTVLVSELETLCRDAGIVPGQEPLDLADSAFDVTLTLLKTMTLRVVIENRNMIAQSVTPSFDSFAVSSEDTKGISLSRMRIFSSAETNGLTPRAFFHQCHPRRHPT